jgi:lipopolysaccharide export system permease protein
MASYPGVVSGPFAGSPRRRSPPAPILDAYILREMALPFSLGLAAYLVFQFINIFFLAADYVINQHASIALVLRFLIFRVPAATPQAFVFGCLLGTMIAFGRLVHDNEITALRTSGVSFWRIARVPLLVGAAASLLSWWVNEEVSPLATQLSSRTFYQIIYHTAVLPIEPQIFRKDDVNHRVFYVDSVDPQTHVMYNISIWTRSSAGGFSDVLTATQAYIQDGMIHLRHPVSQIFNRAGFVSVANTDTEMTIPLPMGESADEFFNAGGGDLGSVTTSQLRSQVKALAGTGTGGSALDTLKITLQLRYALPWGCFIAIMAALPLAVIFGRRGRELGMALALVVMFVYYLALSAATALGRNGVVEAHVAAWAPNAVLGLMGLVLIRRIDR